jgi:general secretion pathway protein A
LSFYGLTDAPFELTHRSKFLYGTTGHREALHHLGAGLCAGRPVTLLIGAPGLGKTTVLNEVSAANRQHVRVVCITDPTLPSAELLAPLFAECEARVPSNVASEQIGALRTILAQRQARGVLTALAVDEAESLSDDALQQLCLLVTLRNRDAQLLPLVLAGNASLRSRLNRPGFRPLAADSASTYELAPLRLAQTASYILWRVTAAGAVGGALFTREAVALVHHIAQGIPRTISVICDNALLHGFARRLRPVTRDVVFDVCRTLDLLPPATPAESREAARVRATAGV